MKIFLIRHGETTGDIEDRFGGDYDDHLTQEGVEQAKKLASQLEEKKIEVVFHSPRHRATETADIVAKTLNVPSKVVENIRERNNYGILTGMTKTEAKQKHPVEYEKLTISKTHHDVKESESYEELKKRIIPAFEEIESNKFNVIAIVSHGGVISTLVREFFKFGTSVKLDDCSYIELERKEGKYMLISSEGVSISN